MRSLNGAADWSDMSDWSDYDDAASDTSDGDAAENSYFEWCDELADRDELLAAQHGSAASSSARDAAHGSSDVRSARAGGRPPVVPMDEATLRWLCLEGYANSQIAAYFFLLVCFHMLEYLLTAAFRPDTLSFNDFLINHSFLYQLMVTLAWAEYWLEWSLLGATQWGTAKQYL